MIVRLYSPTGGVVNLQASQVVVLADDGTPLACSYQAGQAIVHSDARERDWGEVMRDLGLKAKATK